MKFEYEQYFISLNPDWDNPAYKMKLNYYHSKCTGAQNLVLPTKAKTLLFMRTAKECHRGVNSKYKKRILSNAGNHCLKLLLLSVIHSIQ